MPKILLVEDDAIQIELIRRHLEPRGYVVIIAKTGQEPFIRSEFMDVGILMRLRYQALAVDRQRISSDIVRRVYQLFAEHPEVHFCYPRSEVYYHAGQPPALHGAVRN